MAIDKHEQKRRGIEQKKDFSRVPSFTKLEWRVMDNPAFADLSSSAVRLMCILMRQLNGKNNGHLQATYSYASRFGFNSEHTLQDAIAQLISHGFIYRTRSHGANRTWARYAVTWLKPQHTGELFLAGFVKDAFEKWEPSEKKPARKKCRKRPAENAVSPIESLQKVQESAPQKLQSMNIQPSITVRAGSGMKYWSNSTVRQSHYKPRFAQHQNHQLRC